MQATLKTAAVKPAVARRSVVVVKAQTAPRPSQVKLDGQSVLE